MNRKMALRLLHELAVLLLKSKRCNLRQEIRQDVQFVYNYHNIPFISYIQNSFRISCVFSVGRMYSPSKFGRSVGVYLAFVKIILVKNIYYHSMFFHFLQ